MNGKLHHRIGDVIYHNESNRSVWKTIPRPLLSIA